MTELKNSFHEEIAVYVGLTQNPKVEVKEFFNEGV
jgi:hypothetical protein